MAEEIAFENGRISNSKGLVTVTLILDRVILHTVVYHSSTSTYKPNFIEIEVTFCGRTDVLTDGRTFETGFIRLNQLCRRVDQKCVPTIIMDGFSVIGVQRPTLMEQSPFCKKSSLKEKKYEGECFAFPSVP